MQLTVEQFTEQFKHHIRVLLDYDALTRHDEIAINTGYRNLKEMSDYYCPWYYNGKRYSCIPEEIINDASYRAIHLSQGANFPETVEYIKKRRTYPKKLWPVPIMTDLATHQTLLLDGNHIMSTLVHYEKFEQNIPVCEVAGRDLSDVLIDFEFLKRSVGVHHE
ncbi:MAG TPA: hypothetical protein VGS28_02445 [Candidatus Saccharimonadales bacterium]|nr:hypothetical protein [Candidatus Saccharimonadales bacterium]